MHAMLPQGLTIMNNYSDLKRPIVYYFPGGGGGFGGGYDFLRGFILGVNFENAKNVREVEILRHRTGLLCCQTILSLIEANPRFMQKKTKTKTKTKSKKTKTTTTKKTFCGSLSATKCYPYQARPRNLSAISLARNVACMYASTPMHTAEIWKI